MMVPADERWYQAADLVGSFYMSNYCRVVVTWWRYPTYLVGSGGGGKKPVTQPMDLAYLQDLSGVKDVTDVAP